MLSVVRVLLHRTFSEVIVISGYTIKYSLGKVKCGSVVLKVLSMRETLGPSLEPKTNTRKKSKAKTKPVGCGQKTLKVTAVERTMCLKLWCCKDVNS
jgi:hypothetical protein